jgi:hypothetical protein
MHSPKKTTCANKRHRTTAHRISSNTTPTPNACHPERSEGSRFDPAPSTTDETNSQAPRCSR